MHLEKATAGGEAGVTGWISSNDVTLFTVVLVVVVAVFFQSNLIDSEDKNQTLDDQRLAAQTTLEQTQQDLQKTEETLRQQAAALEDAETRELELKKLLAAQL